MSTFETEQQEGVRSSIKLTRNAKGDTQIEIKVRVGDTEAEINEARRIAVATYKGLRDEFGAAA